MKRAGTILRLSDGLMAFGVRNVGFRPELLSNVVIGTEQSAKNHLTNININGRISASLKGGGYEKYMGRT